MQEECLKPPSLWFVFPTLCNEICGYFQFCPLPSACTKQQLTQKLNIGQMHEEFQGLVEKTALHESSDPFLTQFEVYLSQQTAL